MSVFLLLVLLALIVDFQNQIGRWGLWKFSSRIKCNVV